MCNLMPFRITHTYGGHKFRIVFALGRTTGWGDIDDGRSVGKESFGPHREQDDMDN